MEKEKNIKTEGTMKKKKQYIAPEIRVIEIEQGCIMNQSWKIFDDDENGNPSLDDSGHVIEGDLPGTSTNPSKDSNPFSGDWEL